MELKVCNKTFILNEGQQNYNEAYKTFQNSAILAARKMEADYWRYGDILTVVNKLGTHFEKIVENQTYTACKMLYENGILTITEEYFFETYYSKYLDVDKYLSRLNEELEEIHNLDVELASQLAIKQMSRSGSWIGGGNGIVGSIIGSLTAAAFNGARRAVNNISDSFKTVSNNAKVRSRLTTLYEDYNTCIQIERAVYNVAFDALLAYHKALNDNGVVFNTGYHPRLAESMCENALKFETDEEKKKDILIECLFMYPYNSDFYSALRKNYSETNGLDEFEEYFSMKMYREFNEALDSKPILQKIRKMPEDTVTNRFAKLRRYIEHENQYKANLTIDIRNLLSKIRKENSNDLMSVYACINELQYIIDPQNRTESALTYFIDQKQILEKEDEQRKLKKLPLDTIEQKSIAITRWVEHSKKHNVNANKQVSELFLDIASLIKWETDISQCLPALKKYQGAEDELLELGKKAFSIKRNMLKSEEKILLRAPWLISENLFLALRLAREGDLFYQAWFVNAIYSTDVEKALKSMTPTQRKENELFLSIIEEIVTFLFDRPDEYAFDLFMRLKFNMLEESWADVAECLSPFCEKKGGYAGKFAYARAIIETDRTKTKELIPMISEAADRGYPPAIKFLSEYYLPDEPQYVYYQILFRGNTWYNYIYEKNIYEEAYAIPYLRLLYLLISQNVSGLNDIVSCLKTTWITEKFEIGTKLAVNEEALKLARARVKISEKYPNCAIILSLKNNDGQVFAFSNSGMYCYDENREWCGISYISFQSDLSLDRPNFLPHCFELNASELNIIWQTYLIFYFATKHYSADVKQEFIEPMALCGNPYAICRMLVDANTSDDRREVYERKLKSLKRMGKYFAI